MGNGHDLVLPFGLYLIYFTLRPTSLDTVYGQDPCGLNAQSVTLKPVVIQKAGHIHPLVPHFCFVLFCCPFASK